MDWKGAMVDLYYDDEKYHHHGPFDMQNCDLVNELFEDEDIKYTKKLQTLYRLMNESKYEYYMKHKKFQEKLGYNSCGEYSEHDSDVDSSDEESSNGSDDSDSRYGKDYQITYSSLGIIEHTKRLFNIVIFSGNRLEYMRQVYGLPSAEMLCNSLKRCLAYSAFTKSFRSKISGLTIDWRTQELGYTEYIEKELKKMNRHAHLSKQGYERSKRVCQNNNTNLYGWNHMN